MSDVQDKVCDCCGRPSSTNGIPVRCISETAVLSKGKDGNSSTTWQTTDKRDWNLVICSQCISSKYEGRLTAERVETKKHLKTSIFCLIGSTAFFPIASTGIFKGMGGITGLLALFWTGCLLFGVFGTPGYFYTLTKRKRALVNYRQSRTIPDIDLGVLYVKEGERILTGLETGNADNRIFSRYSLPGHEDTNSVKRRRITLPPST